MSDPREGFAFHGKGFYKAALRYQFDPALLGNRRADAAGGLGLAGHSHIASIQSAKFY
jgi:hypothetical protein